jgi:hypothetical protein
MTSGGLARIALRVGDRWFQLDAACVHAIDGWQAPIPIPWPTPFIGLLLVREELVPVLDERALGCAAGARRTRVLVCSVRGARIAVTASELVFSAGDEPFADAELAAAPRLEPELERACTSLASTGYERA